MKILNVRIDPVTRNQALAALAKGGLIVTPNPEILLEANRNPAYFKALEKADLMLPDGHGLFFVSTLLSIRSKSLRAVLYLPALFLFLFWKAPFKRVLPEVIHGSDFMGDMVDWAAAHNQSVFFLGGFGNVAERTAAFFQKKYPKLLVAGFSSLNPGKEAFEQVKESRAQMLFVAYGAPKQELWMAEYCSQLPHLHVAIGVGGSFDFWSGNIKRAPKMLQKMGLEWVWRLILNPMARAKRIWNAFVVFPLKATFFSPSQPVLPIE